MSTAELVPAAEAAQEPTPVLPSIGRKLAEAREAQHLSIADVANRLKLSVSQIEALERDAYDRLPGPVFVRGFARNYARLLRLDPDDVVQSVDAHLPKPPAPQPAGSDANIPMPEDSGGRWRWLLGIAAVVFLGAALIDMLWEEASKPVPVVEPTATVAVPVVAETASAPLAVSDAPAASAVIAEPAVPVATAPAATPAAVTAPAPVATTAVVAAPAPGSRVLNVAFEQACWIQVKDAGGKVLLEGLFPAGSSRQVAAPPPLSVVLGNAPGVRLTYGDRVVDLGPQTRDSVARITLE